MASSNISALHSAVEHVFEMIIHYPLTINFIMSVAGFIFAVRLLPKCFDLFIHAGLSGKDMSKKVLPGRKPPMV